jgi:hypothetical protein
MACEICDALADHLRVERPFSGQSSPDFPPQVARLQTVTGRSDWQRIELRRCPLCDTHYRYERDQDHDHFYPDSWETLDRLTLEEALALLGG